MQFSTVIGQLEVKSRLIKSVKENRVSHALLFLGAEGSGSLPLAIAFAQYLVCENQGEDDACGKCPACVKMKKLVHPDVTFSYPVTTREKLKNPKSVDFITEWRKAVLHNPYLGYNEWITELDSENKQGNISVDESADILHRLSLKSVEAPYKIVIIWLAEKMNAAASNKMLKIIEEPPDQTFFFLISENYEQILPTILSRTQLVKLKKINDEDMTNALMERHSLAKESAQNIAHRSGGNYLEAMNLIHHHDEEQNENKRFLEWMRACLKMNLKTINDLTQELADTSREQQKLFLQNGLHILRECLVINYADSSMIHFEGEELESFRKFSPFVNANNAERFIEEFNKAHFHLERNANFKILFADLSFKVNGLLHVK
ncbi:MAG: DNA polymerase III subunit delta [Bacteroidetes bacterium]|nr:DNA polymerase III subunit delta [Bacteroidota bacterium]